jgi:chemotaxis protein MotB
MPNITVHFRACVLVALTGAAAFSSSGCGRRWQMRQAQLQTMEMYKYSQGLGSQLAQSQQSAAQYEQMAAQLQASLDTANQRIANLTNERGALQDEYKNLLTGLKPGDNPLNSAANRKFEELARKYPEFEFDPTTGVSRFNGDLLFASGSDEIRDKGRVLLTEFSKIMSDPDTKQFHILVVGHTDDMAIARNVTRASHPTNWDLSVHRSTAVVKTLAKMGIEEPRLGAAGYSMYQNAVPNSDDSARQQNRRVEIFVLAPDAAIAGREPGVRR